MTHITIDNAKQYREIVLENEVETVDEDTDDHGWVYGSIIFELNGHYYQADYACEPEWGVATDVMEFPMKCPEVVKVSAESYEWVQRDS